MKSDDIQKLWEDPKNWKHFYYYCPEDPRAIVPKRKIWGKIMGWTINFAHPLAWVHLVASVVLTPLALIGIDYLLSLITGLPMCNIPMGILAIVITITLLCVLSVYQSDPKRFDK